MSAKSRETKDWTRGPRTCVNCITEDPCLWKLEAQIDAIQQHARIALSLMRQITPRHKDIRKLL